MGASITATTASTGTYNAPAFWERLWRQSGMATGKDQPQAVVSDALIFRRLAIIRSSDFLRGE